MGSRRNACRNHPLPLNSFPGYFLCFVKTSIWMPRTGWIGKAIVAYRTLRIRGQVFHYGVATDRPNERDPSGDRGALPPVKGGYFGAITQPNNVGGFYWILPRFGGPLS